MDLSGENYSFNDDGVTLFGKYRLSVEPGGRRWRFIDGPGELSYASYSWPSIALRGFAVATLEAMSEDLIGQIAGFHISPELAMRALLLKEIAQGHFAKAEESTGRIVLSGVLSYNGRLLKVVVVDVPQDHRSIAPFDASGQWPHHS